MLGIAAKAGSVASGEFSTEKAVKEGTTECQFRENNFGVQFHAGFVLQ